ncbi:TonB-dependent receptor domain-containing protein [Terriglobus aquaticus]
MHYTQWRNTFNNSGFDHSPFVLAPNPLSSQRFYPNIGSVFLLSYSNSLTDKVVMTAGFGWVGEINNQFNHLTGINSPVVQQSIISPNINFGGGQGYTSWGTSGSNTGSVNRKLGLDFVNNWLWTKGRHTFNIGGEIRRSFQDDNEEQTAGGQFNFSNHQTSIHDPGDANFKTFGNPFASFLLGLPDNALRSNSQELKLRNIDYSPYIQDDIKITPRLTVNLGLRWDIQVPFTEVHQNVVYFDANVQNPSAVNLGGQPLFGAVSRLGYNGQPSRVGTHFGHFGPRLGFAYKLNDKTVVQGGFSLAFLNGGAYEYGTNKVAVNYGNLLVGSFVRGTTNSYTSSYGQWDGNPLPNPQATPYNPSLGNGQNVNALNTSTDGFAPYSQQWNVNVQRQLPFRTFLTASWVGNRVIHLPSNLNPIDQLDPKYLALGAKLADVFQPGQTQLDGVNLPYGNFVKDFGGSATVAQALRPYPQFNNIMNNFEGFGTAYYQSLQVEVDKHLSNGLSFLVGYTLSRSLDNASSGFSSFVNGGINKYDQRPEWSISGADEPNTLKVSGTYELPLGPGKPFLNNKGVTGQLTGGWKIGWILDYEQGTPFGVVDGSSPLNGFNRPNRNASVPLKTASYDLVKKFLIGGKQGSAPQIFNPAAFTSTGSQYVIGTAKRNYSELRSPNYYNEAASLEKSFFLTERYRFTLKMDYFNLLNRTYLAGGTNTDLSNGSFGLFNPSTNTNNRQGQITGKFTF